MAEKSMIELINASFKVRVYLGPLAQIRVVQLNVFSRTTTASYQSDIGRAHLLFNAQLSRLPLAMRSTL
jgi:hypothetical protein